MRCWYCPAVLAVVYVPVRYCCVNSITTGCKQMLRFLIKLSISVAVIIFCSQIGKRLPTLAGLIAVMPLTGLIVLVWLYVDNPGDSGLITNYCKGALWGIVPSVLFFLTAFICFRRQLILSIVLAISFGIWVIAAAVHQYLLGK